MECGFESTALAAARRCVSYRAHAKTSLNLQHHNLHPNTRPIVYRPILQATERDNKLVARRQVNSVASDI
jgi:hypothetical protein